MTSSRGVNVLNPNPEAAWRINAACNATWAVVYLTGWTMPALFGAGVLSMLVLVMLMELVLALFNAAAFAAVMDRERGARAGRFVLLLFMLVWLGGFTFSLYADTGATWPMLAAAFLVVRYELNMLNRPTLQREGMPVMAWAPAMLAALLLLAGQCLAAAGVDGHLPAFGWTDPVLRDPGMDPRTYRLFALATVYFSVLALLEFRLGAGRQHAV